MAEIGWQDFEKVELCVGIGPFVSECLVTGFVQADGSVILAVPDKPAANGTRLA